MRIPAVVAVVLVLAGALSAQGPKSAFITTSDGLKIHYFELGGGTPVVLIHGCTAKAIALANEKA